MRQQKMNAKILLRIAAVIMLLHGAGHTMGVATWQDPNGNIPYEVVQRMRDMQFSFMGKSGATMAAFYSGFGYCTTILLLLIAALLWIFSDWRDKSVTKILWVICAAIVSLAVVELIYFFPMAVAFCLSSAALILTSIVLINKANE
jgi:hypothetical protein